MKANNTSRNFKPTKPAKRNQPARKSFNANLSTNYELMLRIYLAEKENKLAKDRLNNPKLYQERKVSRVKNFSSYVWSSVSQMIHKANQIMTAWTGPKVEILTK